MGMRFINLILVAVFIILMLPTELLADSAPRMLISEIKIGGVVLGQPTEFVGIYNDADTSVDLDGWMIEYSKPSANINNCNVESWKQQDSSTNTKEYELTGAIEAHQTKIIEIAMNDNSGGSLRLKGIGVVWDLVGWGNLISFGKCKESEFASIPANTKSIRRNLDAEGKVIDTDNNKLDFSDIGSNSEETDNTKSDTLINKDNCVETAECLSVDEQNVEICSNLSITEILPNPSGSDSGNEYIELFNASTTPVNLAGCSITVGNSTKQLSGQMPSGYLVYRGIVLPNADGGRVELVTNTNEDIVSYPGGLSDDEAWALINGQWQATTQPTPGSANILVVPNINVSELSSSSTSLQPCAEGKYRNPETNRCKNDYTSDTLKLCDSGQIRNPQTNRCKSVEATLASLKPCDAGQVRNPQTNRCRKTSVTGVLASCKEGQARNPQTNRCRKVAGTSTSTSSNNASKEKAQEKSQINYGVFIGLAVLILGYGIYEYRSDIGQKFLNVKNKLFGQK